VIISFINSQVQVKKLKENPNGEQVIKNNVYEAMFTIYIENPNKTREKTGWSTRKKEGGNGTPMKFLPGAGFFPGFHEGVLQLRVGERAEIYVKSHLGYGSKGMGTKGGSIYIPPNSNLIIDIKVLRVKKQDL